MKSILLAVAALALVACTADAQDDSANSTAAATDGTTTSAETVVFGCGGYLRRDPSTWRSATPPARDFVAADRHAVPLTSDLEPLFQRAVDAKLLRDSSEGFYGSDGQQIDDETLKLVALVGDFGLALQKKFCKSGQQIGSLQVVDGRVLDETKIELFSDKNAHKGEHVAEPRPALIEDATAQSSANP